MNSPFGNSSFRHLFASQLFSLLGVGLLTVALSLAAFKFGGAANGGWVLGVLLAIKMVAYVFLAPLLETLLSGVSRKRALVSLDLGRMLLLLPLALANEIWMIAALAFVFFALSAGFTPLFQSTLPDILPEEEEYTKALAWSRIAYTLEAILSPVIAAALLNVLSGEMLFYAAMLAFSGSVLALLLTQLPARSEAVRSDSFLKRSRRGLWIYAQTPRLRGLIILNLSLSIAMSWVLVNSVVYAGVRLGDAERYFPLLMTFYGMGAALGAIAVPRLLRRTSERAVMQVGAYGFSITGMGFAISPFLPIPVLVLIWAVFGFMSSLVLTPGGLVITKSAARSDRTAVFAAQFSLSHAGWLIAYPLAGWLAGFASLETALFVLSGACAFVAFAAMRIWPKEDLSERVHSHPELPHDHPHIKQASASGTPNQHVHRYYIDDLHPTWNQRLD